MRLYRTFRHILINTADAGAVQRPQHPAARPAALFVVASHEDGEFCVGLHVAQLPYVPQDSLYSCKLVTMARPHPGAVCCLHKESAPALQTVCSHK